MPRRTPFKVTRLSNITVDETVMAEVRLLLLDPKSGHARFGAMSNLVNRLLTDWVKKQKENCSEADKLRLGGRI
jgi:hypothetical protein